MSADALPTIDSTPPGYSSLRDAAPRIGISYKTLQRWADAGRVEGALRQNVPGGWRYLVPEQTIRNLRRRQLRKADA